jgi:hypothetical protein
MVMKSLGKQPVGKPRRRWEDHKELDYEDGISCVVALL